MKRYWIALGPAPKDTKQREGDQRTPEGRYTLDYKKSNSGFYKAIHQLPKSGRHQARQRAGCEPGRHDHDPRPAQQPGDRGVQPSNWTNGCIAVLNHEMDEIWNAIGPAPHHHRALIPPCQRPLSCGRCIVAEP